ncbi:carbon-nitrogen hydrolase family protein [Sphingomonas kyeonggiensis]|uniref:Putative amidohydrolase n=1 Tax=Sphingomonas kyeonggiensis TaxID=1268553 RepID=A0A7W6JR14_9SPHN|nr:carbon-nitrogen hydrolase family protein [Sphingomonas kyeonggiensis]MBB4096905.1 putative amidohydrolase [Sphingomonas kyeonggiensis]
MKASLLQMTSGIDPAANARTITDGIARAAAEGSAMLFTPEMSGLLDGNRERARQHVVAEEEDLVLAATREAAAKHGIWVHLGSLALKGEGDKFRNRGFVIDDAGAIRASYDKLHLFDVDLATGESWRESNTYDRGERAILVDTPIGRLGLAICYDMRFPDLFRALSDAGATALAVPAAFTRPTGKAHWHVLLRARAIEAAAYLIATAQTGEHEDGRATYGHSLVIDPWGEVLLDMGEEAGLGSAEIDPSRVEDVRSRVPVLRHRRPIPPVETFA